MSLVAYGDTPTPADSIPNNGFWPDLDPDDWRDAERIDRSITNTRATYALQIALVDINRQLVQWQQKQMAAGHESVDDVPVPLWQPSGVYVLLYKRAVYAEAHACILERYRNYSATGDGAKAVEFKDMTAEDYRRDARWAVHELQGQTHTTVELI